MVKSSNAHNYFHFPMERFEIFTICRLPSTLQTDANFGVTKIVVLETEAYKVLKPQTSAPQFISIKTLLHGNTSVSDGPIDVQNLKMIRALEST